MTGIYEEDVDTSEATSSEVATPVDTAPAEAAEPVEAAEPAEAAPTEDASVEEAETEATAPVDTPPDIYDWNGELDQLKAAEWFSGLGSNLQESLLGGLGTKYKNWQRGYTDKFQEMSGRRKDLDRREKDVREQETRVQKWLHGDIDPLEEKQKEIDGLKISHVTEIDTLRREFSEVTEKAQGAHGTALQEAIQEREAIQQQLESYKTRDADVAQAEEAQSIEVFQNWIKAKSPKLLEKENERAYDALCAILVADEKIDPNKAADTILNAYGLSEPKPEPEPEPDPIPAGVDMMNMGMGSEGTQGGETRTAEEIIDQMRRAAQVDVSSVLSVK